MQQTWYQSVVDTFWSILNGIAFLCAPHQLVVRSVLLSIQVRCSALCWSGSCAPLCLGDNTQTVRFF